MEDLNKVIKITRKTTVLSLQPHAELFSFEHMGSRFSLNSGVKRSKDLSDFTIIKNKDPHVNVAPIS